MLPQLAKRLARRVFGERMLTPTEREWLRLQRTPRYQRVITGVLGPDLIVPDCASFLAMHEEILVRGIYRFSTSTPRPYIIDCGANIGVGCIYFAKCYPGCRIVAFEPDPDIFETLNANLKNFDICNVETVNKALWDEDTTLGFVMEGADAGHAERGKHSSTGTVVEAVRLASYLETHYVDMLKVDIEGAELRVLCDCAHLLHNVGALFVEYHSFVDEEQRLADLIALLRQSGFRLYIQGVYGALPIQPLYEPPIGSGSDLQLNIWAYRRQAGLPPPHVDLGGTA